MDDFREKLLAAIIAEKDHLAEQEELRKRHGTPTKAEFGELHEKYGDKFIAFLELATEKKKGVTESIRGCHNIAMVAPPSIKSYILRTLRSQLRCTVEGIDKIVSELENGEAKNEEENQNKKA